MFVNKKISVDQFLDQFYTLRGSNLHSARMFTEKLEKEPFSEINIQFNPKSYGFTDLISDFHSVTDVYNPDVSLKMNLKYPDLVFYGMSKEYLILEIEEYFLPQLKKYLS